MPIPRQYRQMLASSGFGGLGRLVSSQPEPGQSFTEWLRASSGSMPDILVGPATGVLQPVSLPPAVPSTPNVQHDVRLPGFPAPSTFAKIAPFATIGALGIFAYLILRPPKF